MKKRYLFGMAAAIALMSASAASAADWWMLSRPPAGNYVLFVDADTLQRRADGSVSLRVLRIYREGRSTEKVETVSCTRTDRLSRFACAAPGERDNYGLILASMDPAEAASMLFDMAPVEAEPR